MVLIWYDNSVWYFELGFMGDVCLYVLCLRIFSVGICVVYIVYVLRL